MPSFTERRQARFLARSRFGSGQSSASGTYTQFGADGLQTMAGSARVYKTIHIRPSDFDVPRAASATISGCGTGSLYSGCISFSITSSAFKGMAATAYEVPALTFGVGASPGSSLWAITHIPKPDDADTTGSIIAYADWSYGSAPATTGSMTALRVALGYLDTLDPATTGIRTAASVGGAGASYVGTTACVFQTTCLGKLPSFGACDSGALVVLRVGASAAGETGKLSTGEVFVLGLRLKYLSNKLGAQSTE